MRIQIHIDSMSDLFADMLCDMVTFGSCASWNVCLLMFPCILLAMTSENHAFSSS